MTFKLSSILEQDSIFITKLELCQLRLMDNTHFPWVILIPERKDIVEIMDLKVNEFNKLNSEILQIAKIMKSVFNPDKLNIATLANIVHQMHINIVASFRSDGLFPKPDWGHVFNRYSLEKSKEIVYSLKALII
ncbi:MAG: HIT domain-containing protein [Rickettsiaceae bacterium]|nr:HIT domain-containing protein [Rickettsiaceae bacterium]